MNDALDKALADDLVVPPEGFAARVLAALPSAAPAELVRRRAFRREVVEWLAVAGAVVAGMAQLLPLLFGIWTFSVAG